MELSLDVIQGVTPLILFEIKTTARDKDKMRLYLIRHGQSTNNALEDIRQRVQDPGLTESGFRQAALVADYLQGLMDRPVSFQSIEKTDGSPLTHYPITHLYCSAMYRALLTTKPIGEALGLRPQVWVDIHENGGVYLEVEPNVYEGYTGRTQEIIAGEFPEYAVLDGVTDKGWWHLSTRESNEAFRLRVLRVAAQLLERKGNEECIALVTHGNFMSALMQVLLGWTFGTQGYLLHYNTAISCIDFLEDVTVLTYTNRTVHLPSDLIT